MAKTGTQEPKWMARGQIDQVAKNISADDLLEGQAEAGEEKGSVRMVKIAFNRAADRIGFGADFTTRIKASDFKYFSQQLKGVIDIDSPLSPDTEGLLDSVTSGE